jgi:predicted transglutaminase-like cysteine proteinase
MYLFPVRKYREPVEMRKSIKLLAATAALAVMSWQGAQAAFYGYTRGLRPALQHITFDAPTLGPMAHARFCLQYPDECKAHRMVFRGGGIVMTPQRWADLVAVNADVNRSIAPERNEAGLAGERWIISPKAGDCNDFAVTKRHDLLARGWPSRALLLAEVVTNWGEHHLVLVVHTRAADVVADSLNANIRPWTATNYRWVRVQSPQNPKFWSTVATTSA